MKDFLGQEINVNNTIVYPGRQGSKLWVNRAVVLEVNALTNSVKIQRTDGGIRVLKCPNRIVVVHSIQSGECDASL